MSRWNLVRCLHPPYISDLLLMRLLLSFFHCLRIAHLSSMHRTQWLVSYVFMQVIGLPFHNSIWLCLRCTPWRQIFLKKVSFITFFFYMKPAFCNVQVLGDCVTFIICFCQVLMLHNKTKNIIFSIAMLPFLPHNKQAVQPVIADQVWKETTDKRVRVQQPRKAEAAGANVKLFLWHFHLMSYYTNTESASTAVFDTLF